MAKTLQISLILAILALIHVNSVEMAISTENITNNELQYYQDFLTAINEEENFESCLLYGEPKKSVALRFMLRAITEHFTKPVIIRNVNRPNQEIANMFNKDMLIIAQFGDFEKILPSLATILERMRQKRLILISDERITQKLATQYLMHIFHHCEEEKLLNVVVIFEDFPETKVFYSYSLFPSFKLETKTFGANDVAVFPRRMQDLQGLGIRTVPDQIFPWSFTYKLHGRMQIGGYAQKLLMAYAKYKNATLTYPIPVIPNDPTIAGKIGELVRSNKLDIPMSRKFFDIAVDFEEVSQPYGISGLYIMAPVTWYHSFLSFSNIYSDWRDLTFSLLGTCLSITLFYFGRRLQYMRARRPFHKNFYAALLEPNYLSANFGVVQAQHLENLVTLRLITCVSAVGVLCLGTQFAAKLNAFLTKPVMVHSPQSWHDLDAYGYKVLFSNHFYAFVHSWCGETCANIEHSLEIAESAEIVRQLQLGFNTSYAYPIDLFTWHFIQLRMHKLKQPIFRLTDICLKQQMFHCFFLQRNSIFKESLDLFLTRIVDHGLQKYWIGATYAESVRYGIIQNFTYPKDVLEHPLDMTYISFVWPLFGFAWSLATCIFVIEVVSVHWWPKKR